MKRENKIESTVNNLDSQGTWTWHGSLEVDAQQMSNGYENRAWILGQVQRSHSTDYEDFI